MYKVKYVYNYRTRIITIKEESNKPITIYRKEIDPSILGIPKVRFRKEVIDILTNKDKYNKSNNSRSSKYSDSNNTDSNIAYIKNTIKVILNLLNIINV